MKWFNGKKTNIGAIALILSVIGEEVVGNIWGVKPDIALKIIGTLKWVGAALGGVGLLHKGVKAGRG
jgi:hypothetical protein